MNPVTPVIRGSQDIEVVLGANQPEYIPLPAIYLDTASRPMITRWQLTDEERGAVANGADIVMSQLTFGNPFQPVHLQVCHRHDMPVLVGAE
jgi:hypothetical protein